MMRALAAADHDLVHLHGIWFYPSCVVRQWRSRTRRPTVISPVGMLDEWSIRQSWIKKRVIRLLYEDDNLNKASAIHANSAAEAQVIRKFGLVNAIAVLPNGVELPDLDVTVPRPQYLDDGRKTLLFLGRIHPKKGLKELVQAWALVRELRPAVHKARRIDIVGWDDTGHRAELEAMVRELDLGRDVALLGPAHGDKKMALLRNADAFVLPSFGEGMPMAVLEAWSCAVPVLMTTACNLTDSFKANAALEISTAPRVMARSLVDVLGDATILRRIGQEGCPFVEQHHSWPSVVDAMMEFFGWLVGGGPRPSCVID